MELILSVLGLSSPLGLAALAGTFIVGLILKQPKVVRYLKKANVGLTLLIEIKEAVADGKITAEELKTIKAVIDNL